MKDSKQSFQLLERYLGIRMGLDLTAMRPGEPAIMETDRRLRRESGYRRKGYAKTVVSAVVEEFTRRGGEAIYSCSPENLHSIATARSVGFAPLGRSLILSAPRAD